MPNLMINGQSYFADAPPDTPLLWVIREDLRLTGTKYGCGLGLCGSCTLHIDDRQLRASGRGESWFWRTRTERELATTRAKLATVGYPASC
jgi:aerobic-type carbon monoxide dehydrogenase small subunit (CoxS/CutS family)